MRPYRGSARDGLQVIAIALLIAWVAYLEARHRDAEVRLKQTQEWALYTGELAVKRNNDVMSLRRRLESLESRPRPVLPPVGDWEGVMR